MQQQNVSPPEPTIWGISGNGSPVYRVAISAHGMSALFMTYGAAVVDLRFAGEDYSLVLGFERFEDYVRDTGYVGVNVGRFANRIRDARLKIDRVTHDLDPNFLDRHTLHGGRDGAGVTNWSLRDRTSNSVTFEATFDNGHMGFPGRIDVVLTYEIKANGVLELGYLARTDAATACSFAHHGIFNLSPDEAISDHILQIMTDDYLPVDDELIPLGGPAPVAGTRFDFRSARPLLRNSNASPIDVNFCFSTKRLDLRPMAVLTAPRAGVQMEVFSGEPGLQVCDSVRLAPENGGRSGIALEPQAWPDPFGREGYPDAILRPGDQYRQRTQYRFSKVEPDSC